MSNLSKAGLHLWLCSKSSLHPTLVASRTRTSTECYLAYWPPSNSLLGFCGCYKYFLILSARNFKTFPDITWILKSCLIIKLPLPNDFVFFTTTALRISGAGKVQRKYNLEWSVLQTDGLHAPHLLDRIYSLLALARESGKFDDAQLISSKEY